MRGGRSWTDWRTLCAAIVTWCSDVFSVVLLARLAVVDAEGCEGYFGFHFQIMGLGVVKFFFVSRALCAHFPMQ